MNFTNVNSEPIALRVWTIARMIYLELTDGHIIGFPAARFLLLNCGGWVVPNQITVASWASQHFPLPNKKPPRLIQSSAVGCVM